MSVLKTRNKDNNSSLNTFSTYKRLYNWQSRIIRYIAISVFGNMPSPIQKNISYIYGRMFETHLSRFIIKPYCAIQFKNSKNYLSFFKPPNNKTSYKTFQDFFTREFKNKPKSSKVPVWACEGLLCEADKIRNIASVNVKGDIRNVETVFGVNSIPDNYYFTNVFLHNNNYHRIHSPVNGTITRIQRISGDLVLLRPWIYINEPSLPAFRNERVNIDVVDENNKIWYLSIVGGPGVATILMSNNITKGSLVKAGQQIAMFRLGSTFCMAAPKASSKKINEPIDVCAKY